MRTRVFYFNEKIKITLLKRIYIALYIIVCFNLFANFCLSQDLDTTNLLKEYSIEEVKIISNKIETTIFDSPTRVEVINSEQIKNKNGERLSDILQIANGIFIKNYGSNSSLKTISLNGLGCEHTIILLDGVKLNSTQNSLVDLSLYSKDNIEKIEVMNNGVSSIYGSESVGGVVNIVTKNLIQKDINAGFSSQFGSFGFQKYLLFLEKKIGSLSLRSSFSKEKSVENYKFIYTTAGVDKEYTRNHSDYSFYNFDIKAKLSFKKSSWQFYSVYSNSHRNIPNIAYYNDLENNAKQLDNIWLNLLSFELKKNSNLKFKSELSFQNSLMNYINGEYVDSYHKNIYLNNNSQINFTNDNYDLVGGYELSYSTIQSNELTDNVKRFQSALFVSSELNVNDFLKLFPSVRYDNISDIQSNSFSGRFGINLKPINSLKLHFKSSVSNNFRIPTFNELYWDVGGNTQLLPEKSINLDAGVIYNFDFISNNIIDITYTYIYVTNKIVWKPGDNGFWQPVNIGKSYSKVFSVDLKMRKRFNEKLFINAGISYAPVNSIKDNEDYLGDPSFGKQIFYIPIETFKTNIELNYSNFGLNVYYNFIGKRYTDFENKYFLSAVDIVDGNISYGFNIKKFFFQLKFEVNNILNKNYEIIDDYPMPMRNYKFLFNITY